MFRVYLELPRPHEPLHGLHLVEAGVGVPGVGLRGHRLRLGGDGPQQQGEQQQQLGHGVCRAEAGPALDTCKLGKLPMGWGIQIILLLGTNFYYG